MDDCTIDRLKFAQSINYDDLEKSVVRFFDETMALYNIIGEYKNICINGIVEESSIIFDINFHNTEDSNKMYSIIDNTSICLYGHEYTILCGINGGILTIKLVE